MYYGVVWPSHKDLPLPETIREQTLFGTERGAILDSEIAHKYLLDPSAAVMRSELLQSARPNEPSAPSNATPVTSALARPRLAHPAHVTATPLPLSPPVLRSVYAFR